MFGTRSVVNSTGGTVITKTATKVREKGKQNGGRLRKE